MKNRFENWLQFYSLNGDSDSQMICFPFAGGGASLYATWKKIFGRGMDILPVQLPGRENRIKEDFILDPDVIIERLTDVLMPLLGKKKLYVFGHSMGGMLAYKFVSALEKKFGIKTEYLFISATSLESELESAGISSLPEEDFIREVDRYGGLEKELWDYPEFLQMYIKILRNDFRLIENFSADSIDRISAPVKVYYGSDDRTVDRREAETWKKYTDGDFSVKEMKGDHFYLKLRKDELCRDLMKMIGYSTEK